MGKSVWGATATKRMSAAGFVFILIFLFAIALFSQVSFAASGTYADLEVTIASDGRSSVSGSSNVQIADIPANDTISGFTDQLTTKRGTGWTFNMTTTQSVNVSFIKVHLPQNVIINSISPDQSANIAYDDSITITFVGKNAPISIAIQYAFENNDSSDGTGSAISPNSAAASKARSYALYAIGAAAVLTLIGIWTYFSKQKKRIATKNDDDSAIDKGINMGEMRTASINPIIDESKMSTLRPTLNETQLKIIDALIASGGVATQNKIHHATSIPKASLSRNIDILVRKQILQKMSGGYTNQLSFADGMKKQ